MKVRNNTPGDLTLAFLDGHTLHFSSGEISRELTEGEVSDAHFAKALKKRRLVPFRDAPKVVLEIKQTWTHSEDVPLEITRTKTTKKKKNLSD